jgi:ABC-type multidrug transport system fused ATPase/permease subunit
MTYGLTREEEIYLQELLESQKRWLRSLALTANLLLIIGGFLIVGTAFYLMQHRSDAAAYSIGLPNFVGGMLMIVAHLFLSRKAAQMRKLTSLLTKLSSMRAAISRVYGTAM